MYSAGVVRHISRIVRTQSHLISAQGSLLRQNQVSRTMSSLPNYNFETLKVTSPKEFVFQVELNRPNKLNAMNLAFWREMRECFTKISTDADCRAIVITGAGRIFTAGLDLQAAANILGASDDEDVGRKALEIRQTVQDFQGSFTAIEKCPKPVIAAVHNACVGGGVDMITACDIRYCTKDAWFQVKEIDLAIVADVGTLQRLPKVVGNDSLVRELAYTGRKMMADEASKCGLVSRVLADRDELVSSALETAALIATKSPVAVQGIKHNLIYSRDHSVPESLDYVVTWNVAMLQCKDIPIAAAGMMQNETPTFSKL